MNKYNKFENNTKTDGIFADKRDLKQAKKIAQTGDRRKILKVSEFSIINIFCKLLRSTNEFSKKLDKRINERIDERMKN